ncbi:hypothetical protein [Marinicrinis sediminis]|uniref:Peptidase M3 n=1 Tax=Marinicrinis sediminis TaxID=1652465 RepID=A0ABW5RG02_9BACL
MFLRSTDQADSFLSHVNDTLHARHRAMMDSLWKVLTAGNMEDVHRLEALEHEYEHTLQSPFWQQSMEEHSHKHALTASARRQLHVLQLDMDAVTGDTELRRRTAALWNDLNFRISTYRTELDGGHLTKSEVKLLLQTVQNQEKREKLWRAFMKLGQEVEAGLLELRALRNSWARQKGYANFIEWKYVNEEMDPSFIQNLMKSLRTALDSSHNQIKSQWDDLRAAKFGILPSDLRSWHYEDPFLQSASFSPFTERMELSDEIVRLRKWFEARQIPIDTLLDNAQLHPRSGKSEASFCLSIDRDQDVRIACNLTADIHGLTVLLHELGHGLYATSCDPQLPFLLRRPAHTFLSEGTAMLFERICRVDNREWKNERLIKLYGTLAAITFEEKWYANEDIPSNELWWDTIEDIQGVKRPDDWNHPYWAAFPYYTTLPGTYYSYLLGEIAASQFQQSLAAHYTDWTSVEALHELKDAIWKPGASMAWSQLLANSMFRSLDPQPMIDQFQI